MTSINSNRPIKLDEGLPASVRENVYATQGEDCKWGRLVLTWNEMLPEGKTKEHKYAAMINRETGGVYLDCRPHKILAKCLATTVGHFISTPCKLARDWKNTCLETHRKLNPMKEVAVPAQPSTTNGIEGAGGSTKLVPDKKPPLCERVKIVGKCIGNILKDFARAIGYGLIALPIISAVGTLIGGLVVGLSAIGIRAKFLENWLYNIRELSGNVEKAYQRTEKSWTLALCFQPQVNVNQIVNNFKPFHVGRKEWDSPEFIQQYGQDETMRALNRWARNQLDFRRKNCGPFNDCCTKLDNKITYISESYKTMRDIMYAKAIKPLLIDPAEQRAIHEKAAAWSKI